MVMGFFSPILCQWTGFPNNTVPTRIYNNNTNGSKVGIGIPNPLQKLQIVGGNLLMDYTDQNATTGNIFLGAPTYNPTGIPTTANGMRLSFYNSTNKNGLIDVRTNSSPTDGLLFRVDQNNGGSERMRICANGYVGIGTSTPWCRTHINGDLYVTGTGKSGAAATASIFLGDNDILPQFGIEYQNGGFNVWKPFGSTNGSGGNGFANYLLFIKDDGKVGIGVDPASCPNSFGGNFGLYVKGGILTEQVKIATYCSANWPDFVFEPGYALKPLREVEAYVLQHKHLPDVPSAREIESDGMDLADMLSKQMAKIEEITLHLIELNKRLEKVEAENAALKARTTTTRQ